MSPQMTPRARDGKSFVIQEPLDQEHCIDVFSPIKPVSLRALHRLQRGEFCFPVPQNKGLRIGDAADFADAIKILFCGDFLMAVSGHYRFYPMPICRQVNPLCAAFAPDVPCHRAPRSRKRWIKRIGDAKEIELLAQTVFQKALVAEMQALAAGW